MARLLIQDGEKNVRVALAQAFRRAGDAVEALADADEAVEAAAHGRFDLVLVDQPAPGAAREIVARLRREAPESVIVVMSACASVEDAVEAMRLGARSFLRKPIDPSEVRRLLPARESAAPAPEELLTLETLERRQILATLERVGWNRRRAAKILQISTTTLWRRLKTFGVGAPQAAPHASHALRRH